MVVSSLLPINVWSQTQTGLTNGICIQNSCQTVTWPMWRSPKFSHLTSVLWQSPDLCPLTYMKTWTLPLELPPTSMFWVGWNTFREHTDPRVSGSLRLRRILPPQSYTWIYKVKTGELDRRELTLAIII